MADSPMTTIMVKHDLIHNFPISECFQTENIKWEKIHSIISTDRHQCCADSRFIFTTFFRNFPKPDDDDDEQRIIKIKVRSDESWQRRDTAMCQVWPRSVAQQQRPVAITRILFFVSMILSPTFTCKQLEIRLEFNFLLHFLFSRVDSRSAQHRATCECDAFAASTGGSLIRPERVK